jgi:hypothetical protein
VSGNAAPAPATRSDGIALVVTVWALVVAGALLTIAAFIGFHEQRAAGNGRRLDQARTRAESQLASVLHDRTPGRLNRALPRAFDSLVTPVPGAGVIHRLGDGLFLYRVTGSDTGPAGAPRTVATSVRAGLLLGVRPLHLRAPAALNARGSVVLGAESSISGRDQPPPAWPGCPPGEADVAGVAAESVSVVSGASVDGNPAIIGRQSLDTEPTPLDSILFDSLVAQATVVIPGGSYATEPQFSGPECDSGHPLNWGDPSSPDAICGGYLPIIHVTGDLELLAGSGQGILLVDGNLEFSGSYRFFGIVAVGGRIDVLASAGAVEVRGAVFGSSVGTQARPASVFEVTFSKCIFYRVLSSSGRLVPLRSRSWKQLFEVP